MRESTDDFNNKSRSLSLLRDAPLTTPERPPARPIRLSEISASRQALVRLCQSIDYGQILDLQIRDREPQFSPAPTVLLDIKLDAARVGRPESELGDFVLCAEVRRLLDRIDELETGRIQRIEVRAGIPRRVLVEAKLTEAPR
jgi:hypothetical protein